MIASAITIVLISRIASQRANIYAGRLPAALVDLTQASEVNPKDAYAALFLKLINKRSGLPSCLADNAKQLDMTVWPAPIVRLYLGQFTPEAVLAAAEDKDPEKKRGQVCEANFYTGELAWQRGDKNEAVRLFRLAAGGCPLSFSERVHANAELKALGAN
jgi:lipoprotein NlpI